MTENAPPTTTQNEPADPPAQQQPAPADPTTPGPTPAPDPRNAEAAKWRRQLREAEAKIARQDSRLETIDRRAVEALAAETLIDPLDVWHSAKLDDLRGEDGEVDRERVGVELARIAKAKPHWRIATPTADLHAGARPNPPDSPPTFGQRLKDSARR